jgi:serine protease Do
MLLLTLIASMSGALVNTSQVCAADGDYSNATIGEMGEASTVLIYSQIDANIKIYIPDDNFVPTTEYILVAVSTGAMGSGSFVSSNGYIATAGHVVFSFTHTNIDQDLYVKYMLVDISFDVLLQALEDEGYAFTADEEAALLAYIRNYGVLQDSARQVYVVLGEVKATLTDIQAKGWVARVVSVSPYAERDLALLKIEGLSNCPVLTVADSDAVVTGDNVFMFGFPGVVTFHAELGPETTLAPSMTQGIVSQKRFTNVQTPCFQTDAAITHGNSGGAGLNSKGEIIGVCSRGSLTDTGQEVAGFDFLIQSNVLKSLLTESSVNNVKGPVDDTFTKGLNYYFDKHYTLAKKEFETVAGLFEYHWRAKDLISECNTAIAAGRDVPVSGGIDTWVFVVIGVVAVVAILVIVIVVRRKKKSLPPPPPPPRMN